MDLYLYGYVLRLSKCIVERVFRKGINYILIKWIMNALKIRQN